MRGCCEWDVATFGASRVCQCRRSTQGGEAAELANTWWSERCILSSLQSLSKPWERLWLHPLAWWDESTPCVCSHVVRINRSLTRIRDALLRRVTGGLCVPRSTPRRQLCVQTARCGSLVIQNCSDWCWFPEELAGVGVVASGKQQACRGVVHTVLPVVANCVSRVLPDEELTWCGTWTRKQSVAKGAYAFRFSPQALMRSGQLDRRIH
jgi:hypothetical protein